MKENNSTSFLNGSLNEDSFNLSIKPNLDSLSKSIIEKTFINENSEINDAKGEVK